MNAQFFSFSKRKNSTKVPSVSDAAFSLTININDPNSSILTPVIRVTPPAARNSAPHNIWDCNYVYIPSFSRYYYISNWEYNSDGTWSGICDVDVLSSWKSAIRASGGYVGRSATMSDSYLADSLYPNRNIYVRAMTESSTGFDPTPTNGSFIIGVLGKQAPMIGAVTYYLITASELRNMVWNMMSVGEGTYYTSGNTDLTNVGAFLSAGALLSIVNPIQYIVSCKWFPFTITSSHTAETIKLWGWDTGASGKRLDLTYTVIPGTLDSWNQIAIPDVVDMEPATYVTNPVNRDRYPVYAPFASYTMITPWGTFDLDPTIIAFQMIHAGTGVTSYLYYQFVINLITGEANFKVHTRYNGDYELFRRNISLAVDVPITQMMFNIAESGQNVVAASSQAADSITGLLGQILGGKDSGSGMASSFANLGRAISGYENATKIPSSVNSTSTKNAAFTPDIGKIIIESIRYQSVEKSNTMFGKPVKAVVADLSSMTGFVQMDYTNFDGPCTDTERDSIVAFLQDGVYIE